MRRKRKKSNSSNRVGGDAHQSADDAEALSPGTATGAESGFAAALSQELRHPSAVNVSVDADTPTPPPATDSAGPGVPALTSSPDRPPDPLLTVTTAATPDRPPDPLLTVTTAAAVESRPDPLLMPSDRSSGPVLTVAPRDTTDWPALDFWNEYDEARAAADLFAVPPADVVAVVGPLEVAAPVAERCQGLHWAGDGRVFVLTDRPHRVARPWTVVPTAADLVAALERGRGESPVLILDVHGDLPTGVRRLVGRLREGGVGMVRYVLDGDPTDEDLATWHAELGRPSVLDLAGPLEPRRVLALLDRGEPVASVGGVPITAELLLALRVEVAGVR